MVTHDPAIGEAVRKEPTLLHQLGTRLRRLSRNYTVRVLLQAVLTVWGVVTFTFFLIRLMPGNPIDVQIQIILNQENISYEDAYARAAGMFNFDPDASTLEQYIEYLGDLLRLDLGQSIVSPGTYVITQILFFLPWTVFSVGVGLLISFTLGILFGMMMAFYRNSPFDHVLSVLASIMTGVPNYIFALAIIVIFGIQLNWFNVGELRGTYDGYLTPGFYPEFLFNVLKHAMLPILIYVLSTLGGWMLSMKSSTTSVLSEDYVSVAEARGLPERRIITAYVGRNASLPLFTQLAINIGFVLGGSVVIEEIMIYWGLGHYLFSSIATRDYTAMQGVFLFLTASVVFSNVFADLLYSRLDPRVRISGEK